MDAEFTEKQRSAVERGARLLRQGGLVVFPTETVYGIGADARSDAACRRIFEAKGRPADNPLIVHVARIEQLFDIASGDPPPEAVRALELFAPGPITVVVRHDGSISPIATTGLSTVALRIPSHPVARALLDAADIPVAAPSANRSGRPSPTSYEMALEAMQGRVEAILDGGEAEVGVESTILDCTSTPLRILRPGGITYEMLREAGFSLAPPLVADGRGDSPTGDGAGRRGRGGDFLAPGSRYRHYQPNAPVYTVERGDPRREAPLAPGLLAAVRGRRVGLLGEGWAVDSLLPELPVEPATVRRFESLEEYARAIYGSFYRFDKAGCDLIIALLPAAEGLGIAIRDRLRRAGRPG